MLNERDYYKILGVPADALDDQIRRAFRARAKQLHPDSKPAAQQGEATREFNLLTEAYETLKDAGRRQAYDEQLRNPRQLMAHRASEGRPSRAFAMGLVLGLLLAVAGLGSKIYYDRAAIKAAGPKNQESLRVQKTERPSAAAATPETSAAKQDANRDRLIPNRTGHSAVLSVGGAPAQDHSGLTAKRAEAPAPDSTAPANSLSANASAVPKPKPERPEARSQFAQEVLSLEVEARSDGGDDAADRLVSLVNSSVAMDELAEAASLASEPETVELIRSRIAALKEDRGRPLAAGAEGPDTAVPEAYPGGPSGIVEIAAGTRANEIILRVRPGQGLTESFSDCAFCPEMIAVPGGQAIMGSRLESAAYRSEEGPAHRISIRRPFAVSKRGISAENWRACADAGVCRPILAAYLTAGPRVPATRVSWFDAKSYVEWLSQYTGRRYRLLSEAEWEYAAQAGTGDAPAPDGVPASRSPVLGLLRLGGGRRFGETKPNRWGLHPLPGNLLEWVEDCWHPNYRQAPADGLPWLSSSGGDCAYRVVRGAASRGEFGGGRLSARAREFADARSPALGFRVARDLSLPAKTALDTAAKNGARSFRGD